MISRLFWFEILDVPLQMSSISVSNHSSLFRPKTATQSWTRNKTDPSSLAQPSPPLCRSVTINFFNFSRKFPLITKKKANTTMCRILLFTKLHKASSLVFDAVCHTDTIYDLHWCHLHQGTKSRWLVFTFVAGQVEVSYGQHMECQFGIQSLLVLLEYVWFVAELDYQFRLSRENPPFRSPAASSKRRFRFSLLPASWIWWKKGHCAYRTYECAFCACLSVPTTALR